MSQEACEGCQNRTTNPGNDENDIDNYIPHAQYLLDQLERIEMNLPPYLDGFDSLFLPHIKREKQRINNEKIKKENLKIKN
jgi:hypothetical protein